MINGKKHVYCLIDPRTKEIKYVGASSTLSWVGRAQPQLSPWLAELWQLKVEPIVQILVRDTEDWNDTETWWIKHFLYLGIPLLNVLKTGTPMPEEQRKLLSERNVGNMNNLGKRWSEETKRKVAASVKESWKARREYKEWLSKQNATL